MVFCAGDAPLSSAAFRSYASFLSRFRFGTDGVEVERLRREFRAKARGVAARLPFAEDLLSGYYCAFDRQTPVKVKAALLAALAYFVLPTDAVPDFVAALGYTDDAAVLAGTLRLVAAHLRPEHRQAARAALARGLDG
jgi:uncharacterized membrane protein YkvA (DUF1232 family)